MDGHPIVRVTDRGTERLCDSIADEAPVEISLRTHFNGTSSDQTIAITMRTPSDDADLAAGYLFTEGILKSTDQIQHIDITHDRILVDLGEEVQVDLDSLARQGYTNSSCGVCGKTSIESICRPSAYSLHPSEPKIHRSLIHSLNSKVRAMQESFERTGSVHASALFDLTGRLVTLREDVGRHNALDKVIGERFRMNLLPLQESILFLSGRISFELVQKASMAGIPIIAAVGAPSTAAVGLARSCTITLAGFVRDNRYNIYCGEERIVE